MTKLTGTKHGDAASSLVAFYLKKADQLEDSRQYFMAAVSLAFAVETSILAYLLVEFDEDNGGEMKIPSTVNLHWLITTANSFDVLNAPINIPSHARSDDRRPKHVAKDVVDKIGKFRNLIHPARCLQKRFDPRSFKRKELKELREMGESVIHSLMYNL